MEDEPRQAASRYAYPKLCGEQTLGDFWAWAYSNNLTNITRGFFAEFLVGTALGAVEGTLTKWAPFDLLYKDRPGPLRPGSRVLRFPHGNLEPAA